MSEAFGLESTDGALIESVQEGTPAARAGIKRGDIVTHIEGVPVESVADLRLKVASLRPGTDIGVSILRDDEKENLVVTLGSLDDPTAVVTGEDSPLEGVGLEPVTPESRGEWNVEEESGVVVTDVNPRSPYAQVLTAGMVILEVNDIEVSSVGEVNQNLRPGRVNKLWVSFRGNRGYLALRLE
jgi:S1-C subfamily serine protease